MDINKERIVTMIALMYYKNAELVIDSEKDCLYIDGILQKNLILHIEETNFLIDRRVIEINGGSFEPGDITARSESYKLTEEAKLTIRKIFRNKQSIQLILK